MSKPARQIVEPAALRRLLHYEPETGKLYWLPRTLEDFASNRNPKQCLARWNSALAGREAFTARQGPGGYYVGAIYGRLYRAHRIIWALVTGAWPEHEIDHEDHDRGNNRFCNLTPATHEANGRNLSLKKNNTSGAMGVSWCRRRNRWRAQITVCARNRHIGYFDDFSLALAARQSADRVHGFHVNHGRRP